MNLLFAALAGVIQGLTEFLPISSSGHLIIFHDILNFNLPDNMAFDAVLHLGTFMALAIFFWRDILGLARGFFSSLFNWNLSQDANQRIAWLIVVGSVPGVLAGLLFNDLIDKYFHSGKLAVIVTAAMLAIVGALFLIAEKYFRQEKEMKDLGIFGALICGIAQAVALIPGVSRSGITIISGMGQKMKRQEAAKFSFLLSLPIVLGAGAKSLLKISLAGGEMPVLLLGLATSAITGYFVIKFFLKYIEHHKLNVFAWYRLALAALLAIWLIAK